MAFERTKARARMVAAQEGLRSVSMIDTSITRTCVGKYVSEVLRSFRV